MILTPEQSVKFGRELVKLYNENYVNLVELNDNHGFIAELKDENMIVSLNCASNGEAHKIFFSFIPEEKEMKTYYKLDLFYDDRYNSYYDLMDNVFEIFTECDNGLEKNIDKVCKNRQ